MDNWVVINPETGIIIVSSGASVCFRSEKINANVVGPAEIDFSKVGNLQISLGGEDVDNSDICSHL